MEEETTGWRRAEGDVPNHDSRPSLHHPPPTVPPTVPSGANSACPPISYERQTTRVDLIQQQIVEQEAQEKFTKILQEYEKEGKSFVDVEFPPDDSSLYYEPKAPANKSAKKIVWSRIASIRTANNNPAPWVVVRDPKATDIEQGTLGNCWFVSALSVVAERPELIDRVLLTKTIQPAGAYQVRLFHDGQWSIVTIDDYFPSDAGMLTYSQAQGKQLWVPLIEKAAAKLHGRYEALTAGHAIESLRMLTGAPCETLLISEFTADDLWVTLLSCHASDFLFGASSGSGDNENDSEFEAKGLRKKHAYSILDIVECNSQRLIKLKNPWGRFGWCGDWSASSELWTLIPETERQQMLRDCKMEGVFWMCLTDFMHFFNAVDVCRLRRDWRELHLGCHLPLLRLFSDRGSERVANSVKVNVVTVAQPTVVEMVLQQSSVRQSADLSLLDLGLVIVRGDITRERCAAFYESKRNIRLFTNHHVVLDPGTYSIVRYSFSVWHSVKAPIYSVLSIYSGFEVDYFDYPMTEKMLRDAVIALLDRYGTRHELREGVTSYYLQKGWCGMMMMIENRTQSQLKVECNCTDAVNVVSTRASLRTNDTVPPMSRQLLMILTQVEVYERYSISHRLQTWLLPPARPAQWGRPPATQNEPPLDGHLHEPQLL